MAGGVYNALEFVIVHDLDFDLDFDLDYMYAVRTQSGADITAKLITISLGFRDVSIDAWTVDTHFCVLITLCYRRNVDGVASKPSKPMGGYCGHMLKSWHSDPTTGWAAEQRPPSTLLESYLSNKKFLFGDRSVF